MGAGKVRRGSDVCGRRRQAVEGRKKFNKCPQSDRSLF
jgi:hypothetical protein